MAGEKITVDMVIRLANELSETHKGEDAGENEGAEERAGAGEGDEGTFDTTPSFYLVLIL